MYSVILLKKKIVEVIVVVVAVIGSRRHKMDEQMKREILILIFCSRQFWKGSVGRDKIGHYKRKTNLIWNV